MARRSKPRHPLYVARIAVQLLFLGVFLALLLLTARGTAVTVREELSQLFLITDPLILVGAAIAGGFEAVLLAALVVVALSLVLPRAYCGWVCPLGTTMDIVDKLLFRKRDRSKNVAPRLRATKYGLLVLLLVMAVFGLGVYGWFDPICIATRSFGVALYPMADHGARTALVTAEENGVSGAAGAYDWAVRNRLFIRESDLKKGGPGRGYGMGYEWAWVFTAIFIAIMLAQAYQKRFWCRNLCPLGAMLGLLGSASPLRPRVSAKCISCDACRKGCKTGAFQPLVVQPPPAGQTGEGAAEGGWATVTAEGGWTEGAKMRYTSLVQECVFCYACEREFCPVDAIHIGAGAPRPLAPAPLVCPGRRAFLGVAATGALLGPAFLLDQRTRTKEETNPQFRPPGSVRPDAEFIAACTRCGECMRVCPTNALHPSGIENGIAGLWTPTFVYNIGSCDYYCGVTRADIDAGFTDAAANLCGMVCPTGAIATLNHIDKVKWKVGTSVFDHSRCLPWARGEECLTCEEQCPLPEKAISHRNEQVTNLEWLKMPQPKRNRYEELEARRSRGPLAPGEEAELATMPPKMRTLALPYVVRDRCIGCGTCENVCPVDGPGGIRVERLQTREIK